MAKKIMILAGSPRENGNTITLSNWVANAAQEAGAAVEIIRAAQLQVKERGCLACMGCQNSDKFGCVIKDEISAAINRIPDQDVLVLASPVYFMGFSAQIKCLIDRLYSLFKITKDGKGISHPLQHIEFALIATAAGAQEHGLNLMEENMAAICDFFGKGYRSLVVPHAPVQPGLIVSNTEILRQAQALGKELAG
ncbi:MAG: flavodoxin family protein [Deltaproteobacteria bacterium]|nr:flavodoxin family protein [Deltaproteobacteria bacterium]